MESSRGGGAGFITNRYVNGEHVNWTGMAYKLMKRWTEVNSDRCYESVIATLLEEIVPNFWDNGDYPDWFGKKLFLKKRPTPFIPH